MATGGTRSQKNSWIVYLIFCFSYLLCFYSRVFRFPPLYLEPYFRISHSSWDKNAQTNTIQGFYKFPCLSAGVGLRGVWRRRSFPGYVYCTRPIHVIFQPSRAVVSAWPWSPLCGLILLGSHSLRLFENEICVP